jgi:hypothetical protein
MSATVLPAPAPETADQDDGLTHLTCCRDYDYPFAACGADISTLPWDEEGEQPDCPECQRRNVRPCIETCPKILFGGMP